MIKYNPTEEISVSLSSYITKRERAQSAHLVGGVPDYAFSVDDVLRQKIRAIPGVYGFFKALTTTYVPRQKQMINLNGLKVGPNQYPELYKITTECAAMLGIGIPTVYIIPDLATLNAYTIATDDEAPIIVLHSSLVERFTLEELRAIIGHECGHIHNNHGIYSIAMQMIMAQSRGLPLIGTAISALTLPMTLMFKAWNRAGEVTADRAGVICAADPMDSIKGQLKLMHGAMLGGYEANLEEAMKQYDALRQTPVRFLELESSHPTAVRRIFADLEFQNSEVLYSWRPEWRKAHQKFIDKEELDARCEKYISVIKSEVHPK